MVELVLAPSGAYVRKIDALEKLAVDQDPREALLKYAKVGYSK